VVPGDDDDADERGPQTKQRSKLTQLPLFEILNVITSVSLCDLQFLLRDITLSVGTKRPSGVNATEWSNPQLSTCDRWT
jgi:hypothetical protein